MNQSENKKEGLKSQPFSTLITDERLRNRLWYLVTKSKERRRESQQEVSRTLQISKTKIKEIEKGTCKDFNAINNYINYFGCELC